MLLEDNNQPIMSQSYHADFQLYIKKKKKLTSKPPVLSPFCYPPLLFTHQTFLFEIFRETLMPHPAECQHLPRVVLF